MGMDSLIVENWLVFVKTNKTGPIRISDELYCV
jgi:hypothetical protein